MKVSAERLKHQTKWKYFLVGVIVVCIRYFHPITQESLWNHWNSQVQFPGSTRIEIPTTMHHLVSYCCDTSEIIQYYAWMIWISSRMYNAYSQGNWRCLLCLWNYIYITLDYMSCLLTVTYVSSIWSRSINSHVWLQHFMKFVCFQVS